MTGSRAHQREDTRQRLLETAYRLFSDRGFVATTTADVAREAGVSHGAVFVHFPTRDALVIGVIEAYGSAVVRRMAERVDAGGGLRAVLEAHLDVLTEYELFYSRLIAERALLGDAARHTLAGIQSAIAQRMSVALQDARPLPGAAAACGATAAGSHPLSTALLFNTWIGLVHHYLVNQDLFAPEGSVLTRHGPTLVGHFMDLVAPEQGASR